MNTGETEIKQQRIIVIEWLPEKERHTGREIYDNVICQKTSDDLNIKHKYYSTESKEEFVMILKDINKTQQEGEIVTLDIETHGSEDGIGINNENGITWSELFEYTRPINIACGGFLIITLSVCLGLSHLVAIKPEGRAPFMGIVASNRSMRPQELYDCFSEFYKLYTSPLNIGVAMNALHESFMILGKDSPFAFILSSQWFDEFFKEERIVKVAAEKALLLATAEGIDEECAKYQIIEDLNELRDKRRNYFNFLDISGIADLPVQYIIP